MLRAVSDDQRKRLLLIGGGGLGLILAAGVYLVASRPAAPTEAEPGLAAVREAEAARDVAKLTMAVDDPNDRTAAAAVGAVARVGGAGARPVVERAMADPRRQVRREAVRWYPRVADRTNPADVAPVAQLVKVERDADLLVAGLKALADLKAWDSLEQVFERMNHDDPAVRRAAGLAAADILFVPVMNRFNPDDPPAKRLAAIQHFRDFSREPGRRARYMEWLAEEKQKQQGTAAGGKPTGG